MLLSIPTSGRRKWPLSRHFMGRACLGGLTRSRGGAVAATPASLMITFQLTQALNMTSFFQLISQNWQVSALLTPKLTLSPLPHTACPSTESSPGPAKRLRQKPCVFLFSLTEGCVSQHWRARCQIHRRETRSLLAQTGHRQPSLGVHCPWPAHHPWCPQLHPLTEAAPSSHTLLPQFTQPGKWNYLTLLEAHPQTLTRVATLPTSRALGSFTLMYPGCTGLPRWLSGKEAACQCRRCGFNPWVGKIPWRSKWQPTAVFLTGKSHAWRSLVG